MQELAGKVAVITGGAGLLGRGMARTFAREGMSVVVADIAPERVAETVREVEQLGARALGVPTDVTRPEAMEALAAAAWSAFGQVNLLCLNAGLSIRKPFEDLTRADWDAVLGVQLGGVLNGVLAFLPRLIAQGGDRHILVTSSMSGVGRADLRSLNAPYVTAKFATVGLSEVMQPSMAEHGIGVSVLCPGMTVADPATARQTATWPMPSAAWYQDNLMDADEVAREAVCGIRENRLHIFPQRLGRGEVEGRHARLMQGFDQADLTSPAVVPAA